VLDGQRGQPPVMAEDLPLRLQVNGEARRCWVAPRTTLLRLLREDLGLTGTRHGCESGDCGACAVMVGAEVELSCLRLAAEADGCDITTVEGIPVGPLHEALHREVAAQCGYCTPGIVVALEGLRRRGEGLEPAAARQLFEAELTEVLAAQLCRCTGYTRIFAAARAGLGLPP
jgi:aerobic-type carbon monoxide dehydrogenase small subunit (CoxS/CutS family)